MQYNPKVLINNVQHPDEKKILVYIFHGLKFGAKTVQ